MVFPMEVELKDILFVELCVIEADSVKLPYIVNAPVDEDNVPENPVKLRSLIAPAVIVTEPVPAIILKDIELASVSVPGVIVLAVAPLKVSSTTCVPVVVILVLVALVQTVPAPVKEILPEVPNEIVLALVPLQEKIFPVSVRLFRARVPVVSVIVDVVENEPLRVNTLVDPLKVTGLVIVVVPVFNVEVVPVKVIVPVLVQLIVPEMLNPEVVMPIALVPVNVSVPADGFAILIPTTAAVAVLVTV